MADDSTALIIHMIEQLRDDLAEDRRASGESRARTHQRMDEFAERLGRIDTAIAISGAVDAQVRTELDSLKAAVEGIAPAAREWSLAKRVGIGAASAVGLSAAGFGAWIAAAGDQAWAALRQLLRL